MTAADSYPVLAKIAERGPDTVAGQEIARILAELDELRTHEFAQLEEET